MTSQAEVVLKMPDDIEKGSTSSFPGTCATSSWVCLECFANNKLQQLIVDVAGRRVLCTDSFVFSRFEHSLIKLHAPAGQ